MDASAFLSGLRSALPDGMPPEVTEATAGKWTLWMTDRLHVVAKNANFRCCCRNGEHTETTVLGENREYLWDFTWYHADDWNDFSLPSVAIEHENAWNQDAFLNDHWKVLHAAVPLRVSFGYANSPRAVNQLVERFHNVAMQWRRHPADSEDLVLLGHQRMAPRDFRVLYRRRGQAVWAAREFK